MMNLFQKSRFGTILTILTVVVLSWFFVSLNWLPISPIAQAKQAATSVATLHGQLASITPPPSHVVAGTTGVPFTTYQISATGADIDMLRLRLWAETPDNAPPATYLDQVELVDQTGEVLSSAQLLSDSSDPTHWAYADFILPSLTLLPGNTTFLTVRADVALNTPSGVNYRFTIRGTNPEEIVTAVESGTGNSVTYSYSGNFGGHLMTIDTATPTPQLTVSPNMATLPVPQDASVQFSALITNTGTAALTGITVSPPPFLPWVTVTQPPASLQPGESGSFTIMADSSTEPLELGYYRDLVPVSATGVDDQDIALTVHVKGTERALAVQVSNDQGVALPEVTLYLEREVYVETEGQTSYLPFTVEGTTDSDGNLLLPALEVGSYDYTLSAAGYSHKTGTLSVIEGTGTLTATLSLDSIGQLHLEPQSIQMSVTQGGTGQQVIQVTNHGTAPLTAVSITPPISQTWLYLGGPSHIPTIEPGETVEFTVFASPDNSIVPAIYQDTVVVTANEQEQQVYLLVQVTSEETGALQLSVADETGQAITNGQVTLTEQTATIISGGNSGFQKLTAELGDPLFTDLAPGSYSYLITAPGYYLEGGEVTVIPGNASQPQTLNLALTTDPFDYQWNVTPNTNDYDINLTLTYDHETAEPTIFIPPERWLFETCDTQQNVLYEDILLRNPTYLPLSLQELSLSVPGVSVELGTYTDTLAPLTTMTIPVTATRTGDPGKGTATIPFDYTANVNPDLFFNVSPSTINRVFDRSQSHTELYLIEPTEFTEGVDYTLTLIDITNPNLASWLALTLGVSGPQQWTSDTEIPLQLNASAPNFSLDPGNYSDRVTLLAIGSDGSQREMYLDITATVDESTWQLETEVILGSLQSIEKSSESEGMIDATPEGCANSGSGFWDWVYYPWGIIGSYISGNGSYSPPSLQGSPPPLEYGNDHQHTRIELSQRVMLEGEEFDGNLTLTNISGQDLEDVEILMGIFDLQNNDRTEEFLITPDELVDLGNMATGASNSVTWRINPANLGIDEPTGESFNVQVAIFYTLGDEEFSLITPEQTITVYPAPALTLDYWLPLGEATSFDLNLRITNDASAGPARNLRFATTQPKIIDNQSDLLIDFALAGAYINGDPTSSELDLVVERLEPGESVCLRWLLTSTLEGKFVEFTSAMQQSDSQGRPLPPVINEINTSFVQPGEIQNCESLSGPRPTITVEAFDAEDNLVNLLTLNDQGWATPNPLTATVTLSCPAGDEDCNGILHFDISDVSGNDEARFFVYNPPANLCSESPAGSKYSYYRYWAQCPAISQQDLILPAGQSISINWGLWIQPSKAYQLKFNANWVIPHRGGVFYDQHRVSVPLAQIHPIVFLPGFGATQPAPSYAQWSFGNYFQQRVNKKAAYDKLFITLQKMGYEGDKTLFFFRYDWLTSTITSARELLNRRLIPDSQTAASVPWVAGTPNADAIKFDFIGHSTGNLVSRAYMQAPDSENIWQNNVRKYVSVAGPHKGLINGYTAFESQRIHLGFLGAQAELIARIRAELRHYCDAPCPPEAQYHFAHDPFVGPTITPEFLPTQGFSQAPYLRWWNEEDDVPNDFPFGRLANPLLETRTIVWNGECEDPSCWEPTPDGVYPLHNKVLDPYEARHNRYVNRQLWDIDNPEEFETTYYGLNSADALVEWSTRLGGLDENVCFIYNNELQTKVGIEIRPPRQENQPAPWWFNGRLLNDNEENFILGNGDALIPTISANPDLPWPTGDNPSCRIEDNVRVLHGVLSGHKESVKQTTDFLTNLIPPFLPPSLEEPDEASNLESESEGNQLLVIAQGAVELTLTDPQGRKVGYDVVTGEDLAEIPDAFYVRDDTRAENSIILYNALSGEYTFSVTALQDGDYTLIAAFSDETAMPILLADSGSQSAGDILTQTAFVPVTADQVPQPPYVYVGADRQTAEGTLMTLHGSISDENPDDTHSIEWDFGDGQSATGTLTPTHTFADNGIFTVTLTVIDSVGLSGSDSLVVTVDNVAPIVSAGPDVSAEPEQAINFAGSFIDPGGQDGHTIEWDFGDGASATGTLEPTHAYSSAGTYLVRLTVTDNDGAQGSDTLTVSVINVAPIVSAGPDVSAEPEQAINFAGSFSDPGGQDGHTIEWDFGDGASATGTLEPTHAYSSAGTYLVRLTVTDNDGAQGSDTLTVSVINVAPIVSAGPDVSAEVNQAINFAGSFIDPGGQDGHTIEWDFGDGASATGTLEPTHAYSSAGTYLVRLTVTDNDGAQGSDTLTVSVIETSNKITKRLSVSSREQQSNNRSRLASISADGQYVAFMSLGSNLAGADNNRTWDIFVRDEQRRQTQLVSVAMRSEMAGNGYSYSPSISADGRWVAFVSRATDLVEKDENKQADIFVHDLKRQQSQLVSLSSEGKQANSYSANPSLSADGRFIAFESNASNLVRGDTNRRRDIFVHDRERGTTERISVGARNAQSNNHSYRPHISADGRWVVFESDATNLVSGDRNRKRDIFLHDRERGTTQLISFGIKGTPSNNHSYRARISADGQLIVFESNATNLVFGDSNRQRDIFLYILPKRQMRIVTLAKDGSPANGSSSYASISPDGQFVAFASTATNLVSADTNRRRDIFVVEWQTPTTWRVSVSSNSAQANGHSHSPTISKGGTWVAFESDATNLVTWDTNRVTDIFVHRFR